MTRNIIITLFLVLLLVVVNAQPPVNDNCSRDARYALPNGVHTPGNLNDATADEDVNGGACDGVTIGETPGVWWQIEGTGAMLRASTCSSKTQIKVKISVFESKSGPKEDGTCSDDLQCLGVSTEPDFECPLTTIGQVGDDGTWGSMSTKIDFQTRQGYMYYLLVQQESQSETGSVWMNFRQVTIPQNNDCVDAIGPVPKDGTMIQSTNEDASISRVLAGYCNTFDLYPGIWFQFMGNGGEIELSACGVENTDGFYFSVYEAADCSDLKCVSSGGTSTAIVENQAECIFYYGRDPSTGESIGIQRDKSTYKFNSEDGYRYYVYLHYARTTAATVTSDNIRFFINGEESSKFGAGAIKYRDSIYGMGPYVPGKNNRQEIDPYTIEGYGSGDDLSLQDISRRVAALSSFLCMAVLFL